MSSQSKTLGSVYTERLAIVFAVIAQPRCFDAKGSFTFCDFFCLQLLIMDYLGVGDVVAVALCEHFH